MPTETTNPGYMPADPRTVIAATIKGKLSGNREIVDTTVEVAEALADWLSMTVADMDAEDRRIGGYVDLAKRLRAR